MIRQRRRSELPWLGGRNFKDFCNYLIFGPFVIRIIFGLKFRKSCSYYFYCSFEFLAPYFYCSSKFRKSYACCSWKHRDPDSRCLKCSCRTDALLLVAWFSRFKRLQHGLVEKPFMLFARSEFVSKCFCRLQQNRRSEYVQTIFAEIIYGLRARHNDVTPLQYQEIPWDTLTVFSFNTKKKSASKRKPPKSTSFSSARGRRDYLFYLRMHFFFGGLVLPQNTSGAWGLTKGTIHDYGR